MGKLIRFNFRAAAPEAGKPATSTEAAHARWEEHLKDPVFKAIHLRFEANRRAFEDARGGPYPMQPLTPIAEAADAFAGVVRRILLLRSRKKRAFELSLGA